MEKDQLSDLLNIEEKEAENVKAYIDSSLSCLHGAAYQLKLLMLFMLRAIHKGYGFYLATEIEAADKFDDVVFRLMENGEIVHIFVQAKHKQGEENRIKVDDLLNKRGNVEYYLPKYFVSYLKIKHNSDFSGSVLRDFIICTNLDLDLDPSTAGDEVRRLRDHSSPSNQIPEMFLVTVEGNNDFFRDSGTRYRFSFDNNDIISQLKFSFVKALEEEMNELKRKKGRLQGRPEPRQAEKLNQILQWLREFEQITNDDNIEEEIKAFFDILVLAVGQPNEIKLTQIMKSELCQEFNTFNSNYVYARFQEVMLDWLKDRRGYFLTQDDGSKFFDKLRTEIHGHFLFNVQSPVESFSGRKEELKTLHDLMLQDEPTVICQPTTISGLGGVGKTELVRKYVSEYGEHYDHNILWIEAESYETMKASFIDLARVVLGVVCKDLDIKPILRETYRFFAKRRCLFVFDNADAFRSEGNNTGISDFLPSSFLPQGRDTPKVLITSRNQSWGDIPHLELKTFKEREALEFIKRELGIEDESQDADIRNLTEILQNFPLTLQQVIAYVKEMSKALKNVGSDFKVVNYITKYKTETENLLDYKFPKHCRDSYTKTTYTIMEITILRIKENKEFGELAGQLLEIIAFLAPDNISAEMFLELDQIQNNKEKLGAAIELLKQYSLINSGELITQLNVHRLVQQVTRIILKHQNREGITFRNVIGLLIQIYKRAEDLHNYVLIQQLLTHSESFLSHLDSWLESHPKNKPIVDSYFLDLYPFLSSGYHDLGNFIRHKVIQERALDLLQKKYGNNNIELIMPLINLSNSYNALGDPKKQKELLEQALIIQRKHYGSNHIELALTLANLGIAYGNLGDLQKQAKILEKALDIEEKYYGSNHYAIAGTLCNLGNAYGDLGYPKKRLELLERSLKIHEKHYGRNFKAAKILSNLGMAYGTFGDTKKQIEFLERALEIEEKHYGNNHFTLSKTLGCLGNAYGDVGDLRKQIELNERALEINKQNFDGNNFEVARTLGSLGNAYGSLGDFQKQKELLEKALDIEIKHYGRNHIEVGKTLANLGIAYGGLGHPHKQIELLEQALIIQKKHYGDNYFEIAATLFNLGMAYGALGDLQKQRDLLDKTLGIEEKHYGENHFSVAKTLINLGKTYGALGYPQKENELLLRSLKIRAKIGGNNFAAAVVLGAIVSCGDFDDPQTQADLLQNSLDIVENEFSSNHYELINVLVGLGDNCSTYNEPQYQKIFLERALEIQEKHYGSNNYEVVNILVDLGKAYGALGNREKQKDLLKRVLDIEEILCGSNHFKVAKTLVDLGNVYGALGNPKKQKELLERALKIQITIGSNNFEVAVTLACIGVAFGALGDPEKRKEFIKRALKIKDEI